MKVAVSKVRKAYRLRLDPRPAQRELCGVTADHCRFVWNWMLAQRRDWYAAVCDIPAAQRDAALKPALIGQINQLPALKAQYPWLRDAPSHCLQQTVARCHERIANILSAWPAATAITPMRTWPGTF